MPVEVWIGVALVVAILFATFAWMRWRPRRAGKTLPDTQTASEKLAIDAGVAGRGDD